MLDDLSLQLPRTTFDAWLRDTEPLVVHDDRWVISASTPQAREWLNRHLFSLIKNTFDQILVHNRLLPPELHFAVRSEVDTSLQTTALPEEQSCNQVIYQFVDFDLFERGWLKVPHYYELFWQPLLGFPAYAFWRYQQLVNWTRKGDYTRNRIIDLSRAAAHIGIDRKVIKGPRGGEIGGALAILESHGIGQFQVHGRGRHTNYSGRLLRSLPLLSPSQSEALPPPLQEQHTRWLFDANIDLDRWYNLQEPTLAGTQSPFARPDWEEMEALGYLVTPAYYDLFLQPLIKPVGYGIWRLLKCLYYAPRQRYTRERRISIEEIARQLDCHRQSITGCTRRRQGHRYWQAGALDIMQTEGVAAIREEGKGRHRVYRIRVLNSPRLLTPYQVQRLPKVLHDAHDEWLERARLDLVAWQQLELPFLPEDPLPAKANVHQATDLVRGETEDMQ